MSARMRKSVVAGSISGVVVSHLAVLFAVVLLALYGAGCRSDGQTHKPLRMDGVPIVRVRLGSTQRESLKVSATGPIFIYSGDERLARLEKFQLPVAIARSEDMWRINDELFYADTLRIETQPPERLKLDGNEYRGAFHLVSNDRRFSLINHLDIESYLAGVLTRELYSHWSIRAFRAQAIAARTYALYHILHDGKYRSYDLTGSQRSQVYGGRGAETDKAWRAVRETHGEYLAYGPPGEEEIFLSQYSACCGGRVNDADLAQNAPEIPPLQGGQVCNDCRASSKYRWPPVKVPQSELLAALKKTYPATRKLDDIAEIRAVEYTRYERPVTVEVIDSGKNTARLRWDGLRTALLRYGSEEAKRLYSMNCRVRLVDSAVEFLDGKGFGHGIGLCQWGAEGKAKKGWAADRILQFYYPGAVILQAY